MTMTITKGGMPESKALKKPVNIKVWRDCAPKTGPKADLRKGMVVSIPVGVAREIVGLHLATYTDEAATHDFNELCDAANKPAAKAKAKK